MYTKNRLAALVLAGVGLPVALSVGGDGAHAYPAYQGRDWAYHTGDGQELTVCDVERDGHAVWSRYNTLHDHTKPHPRVRVDYDGDSRCGDLWLYGTALYNFRVVEDKPNSSNNYLGAWHGYPVVGN